MKHETRTAPTLKIWKPKRNVRRGLHQTRIFTFTVGFKDNKAYFDFLGGTISIPQHKFVMNCEMAPREYWN